MRTMMLAVLGLAFGLGSAEAQALDGVLRVGVLADMSGPYSSVSGRGSVIATQMAVDDCLKAECAGMKIEVLSADHQNKADIGLGIARAWIDQLGVDVLVDMGNASIQLAMPTLLRDKNRLGLFPGGTARLIGDRCMPSHIALWMWDTYAQVAGVVTPLTEPGTTWFLVAADYAFGHQFEVDAATVVAARGGKLLGSVRHPFPATDLSSQMLTAQGSGADIVALANAGADTTNSLKAAREFGVQGSKQTVTAFFFTAVDVHGVGLEAAQGTVLSDSFYWDLDARTRAFSERFRTLAGAMPAASQAGDYSAVRHYLRAVAATHNRDAATVMAKMHEMAVEDDVIHHGTLRADGRVMHDTYVYRVKTPAESRSEWDLYTLVATVPADEVVRPLSGSTCPAIAKQ